MLAGTAAGGIEAGPRAAGARARGWFLAAAGTLCAAAAATAWLMPPGAPSVAPSTGPDIRPPGLLVAGDAGPGWTSTTAGALQVEPAGCFRPRATLMSGSARSVVAVLISAPAGVPTLDEVVARYADTDQAAAGFDSVAANLRACTTFVTSAGVAAVKPAQVPVDGAKSAAAFVSVTAGAESAGADFVAVQRGSTVAVVVYGTAGVPDESTVASLAAKASRRLGP